ncbi:helix-turn-helix transcriptional regulator [Sphaerisporangium sp. NPDC051011]|uniref:helix-turn-helix domain-containing protein n=1 Tax=Sphaerisporangium sp. NPDC051011 TaxID=3155792 RepID=UPI0033E04663
MTHLGMSQNGDAIRAIRRAKGMSVTELAKASQITPQSMSNIELENKPAALATLNRIATALGCTLGALCRERIATDSEAASLVSADR